MEHQRKMASRKKNTSVQNNNDEFPVKKNEDLSVHSRSEDIGKNNSNNSVLDHASSFDSKLDALNGYCAK